MYIISLDHNFKSIGVYEIEKQSTDQKWYADSFYEIIDIIIFDLIA